MYTNVLVPHKYTIIVSLYTEDVCLHVCFRFCIIVYYGSHSQSCYVKEHTRGLMSIGYGQSFDPVYGYICIICTYVYMYVYSCFIDIYIVYEVLCRHSSVYPLSIYIYI